MPIRADEACEVEGEKSKTYLGEVLSIGSAIQHRNPQPFSPVNPSSQTRYLRALLKVNNESAQGWHLSIYDDNARLAQTFTERSFTSPTKTMWTRQILGRKISPDLALLPGANKDSDDPKISVETMLIMPHRAEQSYYSRQIPGVTQWGPIEDTSEFKKRLGDNVGFVQASFLRDQWVCSGVALTGSLFLTSWHCGGTETANIPLLDYWGNRTVCPNTIIDLSWDADDESREYVCVDRAAGSSSLDYAVLRLSAVDTKDVPRASRVSFSMQLKNSHILIIHHPLGDKKQISTSDCSVISDGHGGSDFTHGCDTEAGSSGAPVYDLSGTLIGIHHRGHKRLRDGSCDRLNKAIYINTIFADIKKQEPVVYEELMKNVFIK